MSTFSEKSSSPRNIIRATIEAIPGILSILDENLIVNKKELSTNSLEKNGFLIHGFTAEYVKVAILDKNNFIVLITTENNDIIGYTIGCDIKKLNHDFQIRLASVSSEINQIITLEKTYYHRHIAKKLNKNNVGETLLQALLNEAKNTDYKYIICQIAHKPFKNIASIELHKKLGFICSGFTHDGDKTLGVYFKKL